MEKDYQILRDLEQSLLQEFTIIHKREQYNDINWDFQFIGLFGERGVGKTTIMIQKRLEIENSFYFSADNAIIKANGLFMFVYFCVRELGISYFFIDEIFKYTNWKQEIKNIIDSFPNIHVVFSGSSSMAVYDGVIDLGRRTLDYKINTLSFREFLKMKYNIILPKISLNELIINHKKLSIDYSLKFRQLSFKEYLKNGNYPFGLNNTSGDFKNMLLKTIDKVILEDLKYMKDYETQSLDKLSKLVYFIANTLPSELSINGLSQKIGLSKEIVDNVLYLLNKIGFINLVQKGENISQKVRKEYKIFLGNTNKYFVNNLEPEIGTIREAFFVSEIKKLDTLGNYLEISVPNNNDFVVKYNLKEEYKFEIGGKNKKKGKYDKNTFIVKDDISVSQDERTIPLWLFGFLS